MVRRLIALLVLLAVASVAGAPGAEAAQRKRAKLSAMQVCEQVAAQRPGPYAAPGWTVQCTTSMPSFSGVSGVNAVTYPGQKLILLQPSTSASTLKRRLAHELGHAWTVDRMSAAGRSLFTAKTGYTWGNPNYFRDANEVFAANYTRCAGYRENSRYPRVLCSVIRTVMAS